MGYYDYYERTKPKEVKGGIKSQSKRGASGENWWAKRWMAVLDSFDLGARLTRGRSYARKGQVVSIDVEKGIVRAKVQGSRPKPYNITIKMKPLSAPDWEKVIAALSEQAIYAARLLAGQMPENIEDAFKGVGLALLPARDTDLETNCSCPDWSNPCKHLAAVYILLGEEFDRDPFLIFTLRGITRDELIGKLSERGAGAAESAPHEAAAPPEPLSAEPVLFWEGEPLPADLIDQVRRPPVNAALLKRLGNFPFWRGNTPFFDALAPVYDRASQAGIEAFLGVD
jgi:uncharacterized Zn finger protein